MAVSKRDYDNTYLKTIKEQNKKQYQKSNAEYKKKKKNDNGFFKKSDGGLFSTIGASALDAGGNLIEGSLNAFEGISDWTRYRGADVLDFFGADKKANEIRKIADEDTTSGIVREWNHITAGDLAGTKSEEEIGHFKSVEENSIFGNKADSVFQGVGNSLTGAAVGRYLGAPVASQKAKNLIGMTSFGVSAAGGAEEEAIANGATRDEARLYGALSGTVEAGSEMLFGGLGKVNQALGFSKGALDDVIVNNFTRNMKNSLLRNITTLGIKSIGEGFEEVTAGFGNALAQKLTYMNEEDFKTLLKDQKLMDSFVSGMLSSAIMQSPSTVRYSVQGRDVNTGLTGTQRKYVNEIAQQRMAEAQKRNAKLNGYEKGKIEQRAVTDFQQGRLIDSSKLPLRTQQAVDLPGLNAQTGAVTQSSVKGMDLQQSAYKYGFNPNSEAIVTAKTMLDNRGIKSRFDADAFKNINGNAYWTNKNGVREVVFNPNASEQAILEEIAIHELTHDLMSSENSKTTLDKQNIIDYVSTLDGYKESRAKLEKLYANQTKGMSKQKANALINEEIIADTLGKNIGSQEYIRRLIDDEPSIAKNIYDWVVDKVVNKNGVKNEKAYWNNVKNNFEKAYNMEYQGKGSKGDTKFAIANTEFANLTPNQQKRFDRAEELRKEGKTSKDIWSKTGFEYKDNNSYDYYVEDLKFKKTLNVKTGQAYKIEDVLEGELLDTYPFLRNKEIIMDDMVQDALRDGKTNEEYLERLKKVKGATTTDGMLVLNTGNLKSTQEATSVLSHEVQHLIQEYQENGSEETVYFGIDENGNYHTKSVSEKEALSAYRNHKDEIEAEVTRVQNAMTKEQRHNYPLSLLINEVSKHYSATSRAIKPNQFIANLEQKYGKLLDEWYDNDRTDGNYDIERNSKANSTNITRTESERNQRSEFTNLHGQGRRAKGFTRLYVEQAESDLGRHKQEVNRNKRTQELDNSSFSMSEQLENQATNLVEEDIQTTNAMLDNFKSYLEEYDITNPTQEDIDNSLIDLLSYDNDMTPAETLKYEKQYKEVVNEYLKEQNQDVRYSLTDSQGRELTKEQQEYFKDSKVRDSEGNLKVLYNGSGNHTVYLPGYMSDESHWGKGIYLTPYKDIASEYGNDVKETYVNITKPISHNTKMPFEQYNEFYKATYDGEEAYQEDYDMYDNDFDLLWDATNKGSWADYANELKQYTGYDGLIIDEIDGDRTSSMVIAFQSNQIKNIDNTNPTEDADIRKSQQTEGWQSFLDKNFEAKGTKTRLSDIKLPGLTNAVQQEVQKQTSNALLPIANELRELNKNLTKVMNPLEISQLTPQDANTTPNLPGINRNKAGDGKSKFFDNIKDKTNMLNDEQKTAILSNDDVKYYDKVTNKDSLDKAFERLQNGGMHETDRWFNKDAENADATDVAEGWILLKQYADSGDTDGMVEVAKQMRKIGTKAGQTVQAFNIMSRLTPEGMVKYAQSELLEAYDQMVKNKSKAWIDANRDKFDLKPNEVAFIMDTMKDVSTMEDGYDKRFKLAQIQKVLTDKLPPVKGAGMKAWMRISMLFNPKTQVRNVAGNALIAPVNAFGDMFASFADKVIGSKTGVRTTGNFNLKDYTSGMKKGLYESYNDFKHGVNTRNVQGNRFEVTEGKSFNDNNAIGKALNKVDNLLSFVLDAGDRGFYEATFVNSINNQLVLNNTTEVTQDMIDIATQEALSRTWQDNNEYTKFVINARNGLNKLVHVNGYGLGDILIPFAKTPANLTKAIIDYSPVGLVSTLNKGIKLNRSLTNGQYNAQTQHEFVQSLGKATAGTVLYVLGYALASAGITSGASDDDKDVANFLKNTLGKSSYSIQIGGKTFTYDWAQPIAAPLSMMANMVQKEKEGATLWENVTTTLDTGLNLLFEQSFLESLSNVLSQPGEIGTKMIDQFLDLPARAVPTLFKQITDLVDGTQRQTYVKDKPIESMINEVKAKIPGLSQTLAPSVDTMGRDIQKYGGKNNLFNVFLNPANVNTENVSESAQEIYRLYKETGETNIMPRVAPYYVNKKGEKIVLSAEQRTQYQKASGSIIEENVTRLLESTAYQNMSDTKKAKVINDIVNYSYNIAQMETLGTELSNTYEKAYEYSQIGDISDFYEFRNSIDDTNSKTEKTSVFEYLYNSDLDDNQIAKLYRSCNYSTDKTINAMLTLRIPMKEFVKYDTAEIEGQYNPNTGKTISGSKKNAIIEYVNTLNLSKAQRAILIKGTNKFNFNEYNNDIIRYVNTLPGTVNEKKVLLKSIGFKNYDKDVVNYILSQNISAEEKLTKLDELGFTIRDGRVYY